MTRDVNDVMNRKRARRILGDLKKSVVESCGLKEKGDFRWLAVALWRVPHVVSGKWKSQHRKNMYLSPYVKKPLNSKVIKRFVPELRSRKCFCVSGFLCSLLYMSYEHSMYVSHISICYIIAEGFRFLP